MSIWVLYPFFNQVFGGFAIGLYELPILDVTLLSDIWLRNVFSHSVSCIFILSIVSFAVQNYLGYCNLYVPNLR